MFYFSLVTLVLGVVGAIYLLVEWLYHRRERKFALYWSIGLFLLYWFQIPAILSHASQSFTLTDFNLFFSFAFPASFIGILLIYSGILSVTRAPSQKRNMALVIWAVIASTLFSFYFANQHIITSHTSSYILIFLFFVPLQVLILFELWRWYKKDDLLKTGAGYFGIAILASSFFIRFFLSFFALDKILKYPPSFWFVAIANSSTLFVLQVLATLLLLVGFFFVHQSCCKIVDNTRK